MSHFYVLGVSGSSSVFEQFEPRPQHMLHYLDSFRDVTNSSWVQPNETGHFVADGFCVLKPMARRGHEEMASPTSTEQGVEGALN